MTDRIKLAEAMGWTDFIEEFGLILPPGARDARPITQGHQLPPDPFTDANDDYAVLKWIHAQHFKVYMYSALGPDAHPLDYKIGDYARAALKVLND